MEATFLTQTQYGTLLVLSASDFLINLSSLIYLCLKLDIFKHTVFIVLFIDLVTSVMSSILCSVGLITVPFVEHVPVVFSCCALFLGIIIPLTVGPTCTALIAVLRLKSLIMTTQCKVMDENFVSQVVISFLSAILALLGVYFSLHIGYGWPISFTTEACIQRENARNLHLGTRLFNLLVLLPYLISMVCDIKIVRFIHVKISNSSSSINRSNSSSIPSIQKSFMAVPVRATTTATAFFFIYLSLAICTNAIDIDLRLKAFSLMVIGLVVNTIRNPIMALTTFKVRQEQEEQERKCTRAKKLKREIEFAVMRKILSRYKTSLDNRPQTSPGNV